MSVTSWFVVGVIVGLAIAGVLAYLARRSIFEGNGKLAKRFEVLYLVFLAAVILVAIIVVILDLWG